MAKQNAIVTAQTVDEQSLPLSQNRRHPTDESASEASASETSEPLTKEVGVTLVSNAALNDSPDTEKPRKAQFTDSMRSIFKFSKEQPRPWKTALIRFGPLSGIFCMVLAFTSIITVSLFACNPSLRHYDNNGRVFGTCMVCMLTLR